MTIDQSALGWTASAQVSHVSARHPKTRSPTQSHHLQIRTLGAAADGDWSRGTRRPDGRQPTV